MWITIEIVQLFSKFLFCFLEKHPTWFHNMCSAGVRFKIWFCQLRVSFYLYSTFSDQQENEILELTELNFGTRNLIIFILEKWRFIIYFVICKIYLLLLYVATIFAIKTYIHQSRHIRIHEWSKTFQSRKVFESAQKEVRYF